MSQVDLLYLVSDLQRRLANTIRRGRVHSVDLAAQPPLCRIEYAPDAVTGWLPWVSGRAGSRRDWEPLTIGERVLIVSESGDLGNGVVIAGLNNVDYRSPSSSPDEHVTRYEDGTTVVYNRKTHALSADVVGDITLKSGGSMTLDAEQHFIRGPVTQTGGDMTSDGISAQHHTHPGVMPGSASTQEPK